MLCPRCATDLQTIQAEPRRGAPTLSVDTCARCSGLWLDGGELAPAHAALGGLPYRLTEVMQVAMPGSFACPRCRGLMLAFELFDIPIDLCRDCHGIWLDGGEFAALATQQESEEKPSRKALPKEVTCRGCSAITPLGATYYSDRGLVCAACHETTDSPQAIDDRSTEARRAYAEYAGQQSAVMAHNRAPERGRTVEAELSDIRDDLRWLRHKADPDRYPWAWPR
jgi:Zn-finger nucleic acid-binding protein